MMPKEKLFKLLTNGAAVGRAELLRKLGVIEAELDRCLSASYPGHRLFVQQNEEGALYHLWPLPASPPVPPRIWTPARCSDSTKPYLWIQFPPTDWGKLKVVLLGDVHWGARECDEGRFREYVKWIGEEKNVFCIVNGDLINNALPSSVAGSVLDDVRKPAEQVRDMIEILRPIRHRILCVLPGNHESRTLKVAGIDPIEWIADVLDVPYFNQPAFCDILWANHRFSFYCWHGASSAQTIGGKLAANMRPTEWTNFIMFYLAGHVHEPIANPVVRRCILREYADNGRLKSIRVVDRDQYVVVGAAWLKFWESYAHRAGMKPPAQTATPCVLFANGSYGISQ